MLVLSRRFQESVIAILEDGRRIRVRIERISGSNVRLSFEGPPTVRFLRDELEESDQPTPPNERRGAVA